MAKATDRPTRLIRARDLTKGATIIDGCGLGCQSSPRGLHVHELTAYDVETHDGTVSAICVTEAGDQRDFGRAEWEIVRVYADTVDATTAREE